MANPKYDPKINKAKGIEYGSMAAVVSALTSIIMVAVDHLMPKLSDNELSTVASGLSILACAGAAAMWKMHQNKVKHG